MWLDSKIKLLDVSSMIVSSSEIASYKWYVSLQCNKVADHHFGGNKKMVKRGRQSSYLVCTCVVSKLEGPTGRLRGQSDIW